MLSYSTILKDREKFRKAGTTHSDDFNLLDFPGQKFFKIFFHFNNGDSDSNKGSIEESVGLLAPTWLVYENNLPIEWTEGHEMGEEDYDECFKYNSAWAYLRLNCEDQRADNLEQFVGLLSNISSESPWYFSEITGLDIAMERTQPMSHDFKIDEQRRKISIKCLPDAFDDRIGTLLDLYRSIVWSWTTKREILPANLRKFDMSIFVYEVPNIPFHHVRHEYSGIGEGSNYETSYKYFEFHNCEIDYNSSKGNWGTIGNVEGLAPEYTIDILYDDCFENRYNESLLSDVGDFILWDIYDIVADEVDTSNLSLKEARKDWNDKIKNAEKGNKKSTRKAKREALTQLRKKLNALTFEERIKFFDKGFVENVLGQVVGTAVDVAKQFVTKSFLGNLYTFSLSKMTDQLKGALNGDIWSTTRGVYEYIDDANQRKDNNKKIGWLRGHIEGKDATYTGITNDYRENDISSFKDENGNIKNLGSIIPVDHIIYNKRDQFPKTIPVSVKKIGSLATSNTIANNI